MDTLERTKILKLIQQEVIPAIGCTEPISVALCTAKATEILGTIPEKITVYLSANILKNVHVKFRQTMEFVFIGYISHLFCNRVLWNLIFLMII